MDGGRLTCTLALAGNDGLGLVPASQAPAVWDYPTPCRALPARRREAGAWARIATRQPGIAIATATAMIGCVRNSNWEGAMIVTFLHRLHRQRGPVFALQLLLQG